MTIKERFAWAKAAMEAARLAGCKVISANARNQTVSGFWPIEGQPNSFIGQTREFVL